MPIRVLVACVLAALATAAPAQGPPDTAQRLAAQREAMQTFAFMDGVWRGPATTVLASGEKHSIVQTERIGPFLGGTVKVIEGRGYEPDGRTSFNALGIIAYDVATKRYSMRSYALGHAGDFPVERTADGFAWTIAAGPATIRYEATVKDGRWVEVGDRLVPGQPPVRFFEMTLQRVGDTDWPQAGAVAAR